jgi:hypothetical protein
MSVTCIIDDEKPDGALTMLNGLLHRVLTSKHGNNAEAIRPDLNKFVRDIRREFFRG